MNNVPGANNFLVNVFVVTDEDARAAREAMQQNQLLMASLDAEIAKAQAALKLLVSQRTEAQKLLESNSAPSDTEARAIREIIISKETQMGELEGEVAVARANLDSLIERRARVVESESESASSDALDKFDADIEGARSVLKGLLTEREDTHETLEAHRALLSPIRRIPPEVLGEIFFHCLPRDTFVQPSATRAPLLLTQISSNWRSVALATPALWTSLAINLSIRSCLPNLALIQAWLARSGSRPLSFHIAESIRKDYYEEGMVTVGTVLELYAPHYQRWQRIRLECQDWRIDTGFAKLPCNEPPRALESLHLLRDFWRADEQEQLSLMLSAPRLRECHWVSNTDLGGFNAPFPQLSKLFLERPLEADEFMHILSEGRNIESCQFFVLVSPTSTLALPAAPPVAPSVLRHNLRSLDLTADLFSRVFNQLELPSLTHISIKRFDFTPVWPHKDFMSLLKRSKCALESLSLTDTDMTPEQMIEFLRHASPTLEKLILTSDRRLRHTIVNDDVLRLLTWTPGSAGPPVCPRLSMVKFWDCHTSTDGVLADMIESRWKGRDGGPNRVLSIAFVMLDSTHVEDLRRLDVLNADRIGISILRR
ncbi:hypothetical protein C8R46DRAFT_1354515 [Mycena filopes]|nr:hypothetical protein C8R46DRAFT_1354515 [Mycena filopes]